ncbi:hypothetical protein BGZ83_008495, partial [Gryganskiella cystojenkinii]
MSTLKQRIAQQWPRFTVGLFAVWGLLSGLAFLWFGVHLNSLMAKKLLDSLSESGLGPEEEDRIVKVTFIIMGSLVAMTNGIALFAAIRKSAWATKASLAVWFMQMSWVVLFMLLAVMTVLSMSHDDRKGLPRPSAWDWFKMALDVGTTLFHGWALLVFLRDLRHQQRNVWGKLVKTGGVFEYQPVGEGPLH